MCGRVLGALIVLSVVALLGVGCGSKKKNQAVVARTASPTPVVTPQELLDTAKATLNADRAFHFVLTHENGTTPIAEGINMRQAEGDIVKPDRFKATVQGTILAGQTVNVKVINVGDKVWLNIFGNTWTPLPNGVGAAQILDPSNGVLKAVSGAKNPRIVTQETINGVATTEVAGTIDAGDLTALDQQAQAGKMVQGKIWIGNADHQVYRIRLEGPLNDQEPANIARQIDLSNFNETVDIQPPS